MRRTQIRIYRNEMIGALPVMETGISRPLIRPRDVNGVEAMASTQTIIRPPALLCGGATPARAQVTRDNADRAKAGSVHLSIAAADS